MTTIPSRERPLDPQQSALLFVDVQNYFARRDGGGFSGKSAAEMADYGYLLDQLDGVAVPNMQRLQTAFRAAGIEVLYTVVENLTRDGRDRSLDYKITGFNVRRGRGTPRSSMPSRRPTTRSSSRKPPPASSTPPTSTTCCAIWASAIW
jgi:nicotinamidase-related amidase